jgi:hypothetical protein
MQKGIRKHAWLYITVAILVAIVLVSLYYQFGYLPQKQSGTSRATLSSQTNNVLPTVNPLFGVNVTYVTCNLNGTAGSDTTPLYGIATIEADVNFTLIPGSLKNVDVGIEYYRFEVSTDQGPILNMTYYITEDKPNGTMQISQTGEVVLANGLSDGSATCNSGQTITFTTDNSTFVTGLINANICWTDPNNPPQAVTKLENAQTLYIDVTRISTTTINGNGTVTTPASNQTLQHIAITNPGDGDFEYGQSYWINLPAEGLTPSNGETGNITASTP